MHFILDQLAIGNYEEALRPPPTVSALLNVATEKDIHDTTLLSHKIPIVDIRPIPPEQMREAVRWITAHIAEYRIMVFCNAGVGSSPSVVIGCLFCVLRYCFGEAVEFVARRKPDISILPNLIRTVELANEELEKEGVHRILNW
jgi:protein-tyrosine phosphatase